MKRLILTAVAVLAVPLVSACPNSVAPASCKIAARDTLTITTVCGDKHDAPSDLYPKCQVGTVWPECKEK